MVLPLPDVLPMRPHFRELIWGGRQLQMLYGKDLPDGKSIGESFEVSACQEQESVVATGRLAGRSLQSLVEEYQGELVGAAIWEHYGALFPLLIKLIDAQDDLSIQVHPDDAYARSRGLVVRAAFRRRTHDLRVARGGGCCGTGDGCGHRAGGRGRQVL